MGVDVVSEFVHIYTVAIPSVEPEQITLTLDTSGQHTVTWSVPFAAKDSLAEKVPAGSCNLYLYPALVDGAIGPLSAQQVQALQTLLVGMVDAASTLWQVPDVVGAYPIHAVVVANTLEALALSEAMFEANPRLLTQVHAKHRAGFPLFTGESALHIATVNKREDLL